MLIFYAYTIFFPFLFHNFIFYIVVFMKRALAERAKQSGLPNGVSSPAVSTSTTLPEKSIPLSSSTSDNDPSLTSAPPPTNTDNHTGNQNDDTDVSSQPSVVQKQNLPHVMIPKQEEQGPKTTPAVQSPRPSPSPRPKKRLREATGSSTNNDTFKQLEEEDEDDANASAFYLKHQNRALASELRSVKYQLSRLERERDYRRLQCLDAVQSVNALHAIWSQLESALGGDKNGNGENSNSTVTTADASLAPLSTGSGKSVELIGAFINSLYRLGTSNKNRISRIKGGTDDEGKTNNVKEEKEDKMDVDGDDTAMEPESMEENQALKELPRVSENIAERAAGLQSLIWSLLQKVEKAQLLNGEVSFSPASSLELEDTVTRLQAENSILQERLDELARSRDEITESDRRVRRGLYRLAAGRVNLKEVLKAVASADEDKEAAAAWMETTTGSAITGSASSSTVAVTKSAGDKVKMENDSETGASSEEVAQLNKQISDLNEVASSRNQQIQKVSFDYLLLGLLPQMHVFVSQFFWLRSLDSFWRNEKNT